VCVYIRIICFIVTKVCLSFVS